MASFHNLTVISVFNTYWTAAHISNDLGLCMCRSLLRNLSIRVYSLGLGTINYNILCSAKPAKEIHCF